MYWSINFRAPDWQLATGNLSREQKWLKSKQICRSSGFKTDWLWWSTALLWHSSTEVFKKKPKGITKCPVTDIWSWPAIHSTELVPPKNQSKGWIYTHKKTAINCYKLDISTVSSNCEQRRLTSTVFKSKTMLRRSNLGHQYFILASWGKENNLFCKKSWCCSFQEQQRNS